MRVQGISFLVALSFALGAVATPIVPLSDRGIKIDLSRRGSLTKADGTFDYERFRASAIRTINKHQRNAIRCNGNPGHGTSGSGTKPSASPRPPVHHQYSVSLNESQDHMEWTGQVTVGSNKQPFTIEFDTGSSDFWVPNAIGCSNCTGKHVYNASSSTSGKSKNGTFSISYEDDSTASGPIFTDAVTVGGVTVQNQTFSAVTSLSSGLVDGAADGILGLSFQSMSQLNTTPFFQNAYAQGSLAENRFAFKLSDKPSASSLFLGGTDSRLFTGSIEFHPVVNIGAWLTTGAKVIVNGKTATSNASALIDSGTTIILGTPSVVKELFASIEGSKPFNQIPQFALYTYPCNATLPHIGFDWGGKTWEISTEDFNAGQAAPGSDDCVGAIGGVDVPADLAAQLGDNIWILGDTFMKNVYSVFDFDRRAVGFAQLA